MNAFQKTATTTFIAVLALVAVGSMVRVSGAGLGCPDWPRCWGCWFPPSSPKDIDPAYLAARGLDIKDFNPVKMWIEYINRLVGVTIGFLVLTTFFRSTSYRKTRPLIFWGAAVAVLLVGFEGWLGGQVVRSGLRPGFITMHMVGAVLLLCLLIYIAHQATQIQIAVRLDQRVRRRLVVTSALLFGIICLQMVLGTQVREAIDPYIKDAGGLSRSAWLANVGWIDYLHRSFTWLVIGTVAFFVYTIRTNGVRGVLRTLAYWVSGLLIAQIAFGITLAYGGLPQIFQVLHLVSATTLVCGAYTLQLSARYNTTA